VEFMGIEFHPNENVSMVLSPTLKDKCKLMINDLKLFKQNNVARNMILKFV
jgi:hypothetical protein